MPVATIAEMDTATRPPIGQLLRAWRQRRHVSQLDLASEAGVSTRHVSFIETGRAEPSREMVLRLAEHLEIPLRERNALLIAAGFAPLYRETDLEAPEMSAVRKALKKILAAHDPFPAVVVDRHWNRVAANQSVGLLVEGVAEHLLEEPANVLRLSLHPDGVAPRILNFSEWSCHLLARLQRQITLTADSTLAALLEELRTYPGVPKGTVFPELRGAEKVFVPLRLRLGSRELAFFSTVSTFGTALDITLAELAIESFFPADADTAALLADSQRI
jgi:transcriptional regulator with XRE-family HTH domain